jgi:hypothetical protein
MPSKSPAQGRLMLAVAHGWKPSDPKVHLPLKVAKEFVAADKKLGRIGTGKTKGVR